jgi:hypothetical protein
MTREGKKGFDDGKNDIAPIDPKKPDPELAAEAAAFPEHPTNNIKVDNLIAGANTVASDPEVPKLTAAPAPQLEIDHLRESGAVSSPPIEQRDEAPGFRRSIADAPYRDQKQQRPKQ